MGLTGLGSGKCFLAIRPAARPILVEHLGISAARIEHLDPPTPVFDLHHEAIGDFRLALELATNRSQHVALLR